MLVVKIELHSAITGKITEIGRMHITNNGLGTHKRGEYDIEIFRKGSTTKVQRKGMVRDYPRQSYTVWELVRRGLTAALGKWPIHPGEPQEFDEQILDSPAVKPESAVELESRDFNRVNRHNENGFRFGKQIEPGIVSEEFKQKLRELGYTKL
jgi:hypothetical protein